MKRLYVARIGYNIISAVFCLAALLYLICPGIPPLAASIFSGTVLIVYGVIKIIGYFSEDLFCLAFRYDFAFGLLLIAIGVIIFIKCGEAAAYLTSGFGWIILLDSFFKIQMSEEAKKFGLEQWQYISTAAGVTGAMGIILILNFSRTDLAHILAALALLAEGVMNRYVMKYAVKDPGRGPARFFSKHSNENGGDK